MKNIFCILFLLIALKPLKAQVLDNGSPEMPDDDFRTLFDGENLSFGAFGGPFMSFTTIDGEFAHMMGGGGAFQIGGFFFGGYGQGLTNKIPAKEDFYDDDDFIEFGHGGFLTGFTLMGNKAIHPTFNMLIGFGNISIYDDFNNTSDTSDGLLVFEPGVQIELNLTKFMRLGVGASYRLVSSVDIEGYEDQDFSGVSGQLAFKFGWF